MTNPFESGSQDIDPFMLAMGIGGGLSDDHHPQPPRAQAVQPV